MAELDALDKDLLRALQADCRSSHRELASRLGTSHPTIASRLRRLEGLGVIRGYTVVLDPAAFAGPVPAVEVGAARLGCHWCGNRVATWREETIAGRVHAFCCGTCAAAFRAKDADLRTPKGP